MPLVGHTSLPLGRVQCPRKKIVDKRGDPVRYECGSCGVRINFTMASCPSCLMQFFGFDLQRETGSL